jgi:hypothetical protein
METTTPDYIDNLSIETSDDGCICLEQDSGGNGSRVYIHLIHLRYLAEKAGLTAQGDQEAQKAIATLTRRLLVLNGRIGHLADWLANHSDHKHADLSYELTYASATADIAAEFCADMPDTMPAPCKPDANTVQAPCSAVQNLGALATTTRQAALI